MRALQGCDKTVNMISTWKKFKCILNTLSKYFLPQYTEQRLNYKTFLNGIAVHTELRFTNTVHLK